MNIALIPNLQKENALDYTKRVIAKLGELGIQVHMLGEFSKYFPMPSISLYKKMEDMVPVCDMLITIGGDGTILHSAKYAAIFHKPLLGINCGRIGFMASLEMNELDELQRLLSNEYRVENRMMLSVVVDKQGDRQQYYALNDAVLSKGDLSHMVDLTVFYNDKKFCDYRADGIILSTPTGSTAYSLSAGGPVIDPLTDCILLTPISSYSLFSRSVLLNGSSKLRISPAKKQHAEVFLTVDGETSIRLETEDFVEVHRADLSVKLVQIKSQMFYDVLTSKLLGEGNWIK